MSGISLARSAPEDRLSEWRAALENRYGISLEDDPILCSLVNFLHFHGWRGNARKLIEALPVGDTYLDFDAMRDVLARLRIRTIESSLSGKALSDSLCPCLLKPRFSKTPTVVVGRGYRGRGFEVAGSNTIGESETVRRLPGGTLFVRDEIEAESTAGAEQATRWFRRMVSDFRGAFVITVFLAFIINLLTLIAPLSIMVIYDQVIAKEAVDTLDWLILGVAMATVFELGLKMCRARVQAFVSAKLDYRVATKVFEQVLHLPPLFTERAPVGGQLARLREFDGMRDLFSGPLAGLIVDLPFTLVFLLVLYWIGGTIVVIPIMLAICYLIIARIFLPEMRARATEAGRDKSNKQGFLVELVGGIRVFKQQDGAEIQADRFRELSSDSAWSNYESSKLQSGVVGLSQTIMMASGALTLGYGVVQVVGGAMSMGALIATMMLVWRVLGPLQTLLALAHRWEQTRDSVRQLIDLLSFKREQEPGSDPDVPIRFTGRVRFNRVSMRYAPDANPSLLGVSLDTKAGEIVGIAGDSGAGKSTLVKVAMGLYQPQAGAVTLDGIDIRQLRPITLRQTLAYVPQRNSLFPGSIRDNILLADPAASDNQVRRACKMAGILHKVDALPNGLDTVFREGPQSQLPPGFLRQIALARAYLKDAPVYILDEPTSSMDEEDERYFLRSLEVLRGRSTVLMVTQRPSHMRLCDRLIYVEQGQIRYFDEPERVLAEVKRTNMVAAEAPAE